MKGIRPLYYYREKQGIIPAEKRWKKSDKGPLRISSASLRN